jgi:probable F420-dependent oxidoreductase
MIQVDAMLPKQLSNTRQSAAELEASAYDGVWAAEANHDPFLRILEAAHATERVTLGSAVAIAFARSPMTTALAAYDLARYAEGRFVLGLGSQVKPHIERRYSMPWSQPAARMREYVHALRAIWACWHTGAPLAFEGEFYTHTLMTDFFSPERHEHGPPPVYLAAVGPRMTEVAAEVGDGLFIHAFATAGYIRDVTLPAVCRGRATGGLEQPFRLAATAMFCSGRDSSEIATSAAAGRKHLAFYASTPAYLPVLEHSGWAEIQPTLRAHSRRGEWNEMAALVPDDMLRAFAPVGTPAEVAAELRARWADLGPRITLYPAGDVAPEVVSEIRQMLQEGSSE